MGSLFSTPTPPPKPLSMGVYTYHSDEDAFLQLWRDRHTTEPIQNFFSCDPSTEFAKYETFVRKYCAWVKTHHKLFSRVELVE